MVLRARVWGRVRGSRIKVRVRAKVRVRGESGA